MEEPRHHDFPGPQQIRRFHRAMQLYSADSGELDKGRVNWLVYPFIEYLHLSPRFLHRITSLFAPEPRPDSNLLDD